MRDPTFQREYPYYYSRGCLGGMVIALSLLTMATYYALNAAITDDGQPLLVKGIKLHGVASTIGKWVLAVFFVLFTMALIYIFLKIAADGKQRIVLTDHGILLP